jgi:hypothetical protein
MKVEVISVREQRYLERTGDDPIVLVDDSRNPVAITYKLKDITLDQIELYLSDDFWTALNYDIRKCRPISELKEKYKEAKDV